MKEAIAALTDEEKDSIHPRAAVHPARPRHHDIGQHSLYPVPRMIGVARRDHNLNRIAGLSQVRMLEVDSLQRLVGRVSASESHPELRHGARLAR
jgi:hypothetical protein